MINPTEFDLHIFDLDDTLVNTKEAYWSAQAEAIKEVYPEVSQGDIEIHLAKLKWLCASFGSGNVEEYFSAFLSSTSDIFPFSSERLDKVVSKYQVVFRSKFSYFEHAKDYLKHLRDEKKKLAIVSNGAVDSQLSKLKRTGLLNFFADDAIFISGQFPRHLQKPSPFILKKACEYSNVFPEKAVFYGNSDVDILAGNLAGTITAHFARTTKISPELSTFSAPDFEFTSWLELLP